MKELPQMQQVLSLKTLIMCAIGIYFDTKLNIFGLVLFATK